MTKDDLDELSRLQMQQAEIARILFGDPDECDCPECDNDDILNAEYLY